MSSKKALEQALSHLKEGKVLGITGTLHGKSSSAIWKSDVIKPAALKYRSYNPSLTKYDFEQLEPDVLFSSNNNSTKNGTSFSFIKCRDPKFFQFKDQYILVFKDHASMFQYMKNTSNSKIHHVRVKFAPFEVSDMMGVNYANYVHNLLAAYDSSQTYFEMVKKKRELLGDIDLHELTQIVRPFEEKSALIWDLPLETKPAHVMDRFWFYDIKHCFKLYWDPTTGHTLYYVAFNEARDCTKFRRNLHGCQLDDLPRKLLIDQLEG